MLVGTRLRGERRLGRIGSGILGLGVLAWHAPPALACSLLPPPEHVLDPQAQASDATAPGAPSVTVAKIKRGKGPDTHYASCSQSVSSCDDMGTVELQVSASDDQTPTDQLGYQIELVSGQLPSRFQLPSGAIRARSGSIYLHWSDGFTDDQEAISFSLALRAVDLAGNVGPASNAAVHEDGSGGCSVGQPRPDSAWQLTTIAILLAARLARAWTHRRRKRPR